MSLLVLKAQAPAVTTKQPKPHEKYLCRRSVMYLCTFRQELVLTELHLPWKTELSIKTTETSIGTQKPGDFIQGDGAAYKQLPLTLIEGLLQQNVTYFQENLLKDFLSTMETTFSIPVSRRRQHHRREEMFQNRADCFFPFGFSFQANSSQKWHLFVKHFTHDKLALSLRRVLGWELLWEASICFYPVKHWWWQGCRMERVRRRIN